MNSHYNLIKQTRFFEKMKYITEKSVKRLIKFKGDCCSSCHSNNETSDMMFIDFGKDREAEVCCLVKQEYNKWMDK